MKPALWSQNENVMLCIDKEDPSVFEKRKRKREMYSISSQSRVA